MNITDHLDAWLESLRVKNFSPVSLDLYGSQIRAFTLFLERRGIVDLRQVNQVLLGDYYLSLLQRSDPKPYSVSTLSVKIRALRSLFKFLTASGAIIVDPSVGLKEPKIKRLPRGILSVNDVAKILDSPDLSKVEGVRDRAILEVLYSSGMRLGELTRLTLLDLDLKDGLVTIRQGKGGKDRVVPVGAVAVKFVTAYLTQARPELLERKHGSATERGLWLNRWGTPMSKQLIERMVKDYAQAAGIVKPVSPHTFRHSCATHLLNNGANLRTVQELLGHAHTSTTQLYTRVSIAEVKQTHATQHPRQEEPADDALGIPTCRYYPQ